MRPLVLALNPSVDVEWRVAHVRWEEKNQVLSERRWPGGKGVNVARWLNHLGACPRLLIPLGGPTGKEIAAGLRAERVSISVLPLPAATRTNVIVTAESGGQLRFNPPGPKLARADWQSILRCATAELQRASVLVLSGSLPRGLPTEAYARLVRLAHAAGVKTLLDCDGPPLTAAARARPFLVKPNQHELALWRGQPLSSLDDIEAAARELSEVTAGWVLVSLGKNGALLIHALQRIRLTAAPPKVQPLNTVGAGDALLASVACQVARCAPPAEWLRWGVSAGTAATTCRAGRLAPRSLIADIASQTTVR